MASGKCLDADLGTIGGQGTIVQVWSCGGASNQIWTFQFPETTMHPQPAAEGAVTSSASSG